MVSKEALLHVEHVLHFVRGQESTDNTHYDLLPESTRRYVDQLVLPTLRSLRLRTTCRVNVDHQKRAMSRMWRFSAMTQPPRNGDITLWFNRPVPLGAPLRKSAIGDSNSEYTSCIDISDATGMK
eukprot:2633533-Amphidinium_carterae.1